MTRSEMQAAMGTRIRLAREAIEPDRAAFARTLRVDPATLKKIENGERSPSVFLVAELSRRLGVSTDWLLGGGHDFDAARSLTAIPRISPDSSPW